MINLLPRAEGFARQTAIQSEEATYTYHDLMQASDCIAAGLLALLPSLARERVVFMVSPGFHYVASLWGIWKSGAMAVPLCLSHPAKALSYVLEDTGAILAITDQEFRPLLEPLAEANGINFGQVEELVKANKQELPQVEPEDPALILYTSGTTSQPKGVLITHINIEAQVTSLVEAWEWSSNDHILNVLPLHHVHGIVNVVTCALWSGATCQFLPKFEAAQVFNHFKEGAINIFMAVPTIYYKLISYWETLDGEEQQRLQQVLQRFRLMVSGSAALPVSTLEKWQAVSGHTLLERYGMTEIGMALSNPYGGERKPGHVGLPLPGVLLRLVSEKGEELASGPGEIQVKGENVFEAYWNMPDATAAAFVDGWFKTGDIAQLMEGSYKILGRNSVDIIKSGGYKISALEIEEVLLSHSEINECAVVGLPDEEWGEVVAAALVSKEDLDPANLKSWLEEYLPPYKIPKIYLQLEALPQNALGKTTKNELKKLFKSE